MAKRLISLTLAMLMLLVVFASCAKDEDAISDTIDDASRFTTTLNFWVIAEEGMDAEQAAAVNAEINKLTKKKFRTQLNINYISEDEYYETIEKAFVDYEEALAEAKKKGETLSSAATSQETVLNEYGIPELKYPVAHKSQVDIMFLGDANKYREYADKEWITALDGLLENSAGELYYCISDSLLKTPKYNGAVFGVPNNDTIGTYTYLAVDEKLAREYLVSNPEESFGNGAIYSESCYQFLNYIYNRDVAGEEKIYPIYSETGKVDLSRVHYWSYGIDSETGKCMLDPSCFSLFGGFYFSDSYQGGNVATMNLLADSSYQAMLAKKAVYEYTGKNTAEPEDDFLTTDPNAKAAVRVVTGDWQEKAELEEMGYTVLTVDVPRATDENVFGSMFAIGSHTSDEQRSMEIIAYLSTNSEIRNLLQYGIEGVNYTLETVKNEDGESLEYVVPTLENKYMMDIKKTGNVFIAYPDSPEKALIWEYGKMQNRDAITYPTLGMYFKSEYNVDKDAIRVLGAVSAKVEEKILGELFVSEQAVKEFFKDGVFPKESENLQMATYLLNAIGEPVTYKNGEGETKTVTAAALASAIAVMKTTGIDKTEGALQSPTALYQLWYTVFNGL